jgi:hypothetical protein
VTRRNAASLCALLFVVSVVTACGARSSTVVTPSPVASRAGLGAYVNRDLVLQDAQKQATRVDRIEAKLTTYATWKASRPDPVSGPVSTSPSLLVWVVAVGGEIQPQFGHGEILTWDEFVYDAATGNILGDAGNNDVRWPPGFDSLVDLSTAPTP